MMRGKICAAALLLLGVGVVGGASPAAAAVMPIRSTTYHPIAGEVVRISTVATPVGRTVYLQRYSHGWRNFRATRTRSGGIAAFSVKATSASASYRTYAPAVRSHGTRASRTVKVSPVTPHLTISLDNTSMAQPRATAATGSGATSYSLAEGRFSPARPGHSVFAQVWGDDQAWHTAGKGVQNSNGTYRAPVPQSYIGTAASPRTFRAISVAGRTIYSDRTARTVFHTMKLAEEFTGNSLDTSTWASRLTSECTGSKAACKGYSMCRAVVPTNVSDRVAVGSGVATLSLARWKGADSRCPKGHWYNPAIGTGLAGKTYQHGTFAARVKMQRPQGMHGAFWLQGPYPTGAEIDVVEYYGEGTPYGGTSSYVHYGKSTVTSSGGVDAVDPILGRGNTPASGWHVYSVQWSGSRYVFRLDGTPILVTNKPHVATSAEEIVLSMTSPDWELPRLSSVNAGLSAKMQVDWVRAWEY